MDNWLTRLLALNRTVAIVLVAVLFFGLGEQLWSQFMPVYLEAHATSLAGSHDRLNWNVLWTVGLYACLRNLLEAVCYVGGGQLTTRLGDRGSLILFGLLPIAGYVVFLTTTEAWCGIVAALLILGWEPLSVPVTFTTVGASVAQSEQGLAFAVQSIQKRLPKIIGPMIAGFVLAAVERSAREPAAGRILGMRWLVTAALTLGVVSLAIQWRWMPRHKPVPNGQTWRQIIRDAHPRLRRLFIAECFTRWCDWLVREFVVLYVVLVRGVPLDTMGSLFALQNLAALLTYLPIGRMTRRFGLQPFIGLTFVFFAAFPLALVLVADTRWLFVAFVVYGLREIGEPARKAMITSLMPAEVRARGVGLYWGLRAALIAWASLAGAVVWDRWGPDALLYGAFALGCTGAAVYYGFCRE